ncbi:hypothetical protein ACFPPD_25745 [Cohnella suwonensis]|uniref:Uncharacterized protein n=1 Tax=Cohnella suwonensis TaxID=696072 RepID=A0ABW0M3E7_9BACL
MSMRRLSGLASIIGTGDASATVTMMSKRSEKRKLVHAAIIRSCKHHRYVRRFGDGNDDVEAIGEAKACPCGDYPVLQASSAPATLRRR